MDKKLGRYEFRKNLRLFRAKNFQLSTLGVNPDAEINIKDKNFQKDLKAAQEVDSDITAEELKKRLNPPKKKPAATPSATGAKNIVPPSRKRENAQTKKGGEESDAAKAYQSFKEFLAPFVLVPGGKPIAADMIVDGKKFNDAVQMVIKPATTP